VNSGGSGREWYGDILIPSSGLVKNYEFATPGLLDSLSIALSVIGFAESRTSFNLLLNGAELGALQINASSVSTYAIKGRNSLGSFQALSDSEIQRLTIDFVAAEGTIFGFVNQILISYQRALSHSDHSLLFSNNGETQSRTFQITTTKPIEVWDISDPISVKNVEDKTAQAGKVNFGFGSNELVSFVAFSDDDLIPLANLSAVSRQNIRSLEPKDGLIVTAPEFLTAAKRLAYFHANENGLDVEVITTRQIYNEFSSGMQDLVAIRDAIRHYFQKSPDFRYVLLFGDASFDYKNRTPNNTNFVPVYESYDSWDPVSSYSSDDFYGFMGDNEGEWLERFSGDHTMEIGIGRLPVKSMFEADAMVDKIIHYHEQSKIPGTWKNRFTYVADDGNVGYSDTHTHMRDAEDFTNFMWEYAPQAEYDKVYIDIFDQEVTGNIESSAGARAALSQTIEEGTLMVNFIGHGSETRWTEETVLDLETIESMTNVDRLPIFVTATCAFGRYDDPTLASEKSESGAEKLLLKAEGGAIALLTTTRPVFSFSNYPVNLAFHYYLLRPLKEGPEAGQLPRLGDLGRLTKNNSLQGSNNRNFSLLGDPMLRLDYPEYQMKVVSINDLPLTSESTDTLSALEEIRLSGEVLGYDGFVKSDFNGTAEVQIFDTPTSNLTKGQRDDPYPYRVRDRLLFSGSASVQNGLFTISFIVPKNITYRYDPGVVTLYAIDRNTNEEAIGGSNQIRLGGSSSSSATDNEAPIIQMRILSNGVFTDGHATRSDTLLAMIQDASGINTSGIALDRDITLELDGEIFIINHLYKSSLNDFTSGSIAFPLKDLEPGRYLVKLNLYDLHNNFASSTVDFVISDQPRISIDDLMLFPNPATTTTELKFRHNRAGETLDIFVDVISVTGQLVQRRTYSRPSSKSVVENIELDINSLFLKPGLYYCKVTSSSRLDGASGHSTTRLIVIN
jgi:hypothetical protein